MSETSTLDVDHLWKVSNQILILAKYGSRSVQNFGVTVEQQ